MAVMGWIFWTAAGFACVYLAYVDSEVAEQQVGRVVSWMATNKPNPELLKSSPALAGLFSGQVMLSLAAAFLLGAKFDAIHVSEDWQDLDVLDRALELTIAERERVNWWLREPVYLDRAGVHDVPAGIDVRRFVDRDGVDLFAIDNWQLQPNLTFGFNGVPVPVPQQQLAIVEILTQ